MRPDYSKEFPCPHCGDEIEIDGNEIDGICKSCKCPYRVNYDAEFEEGLWRDLTTLSKL